MVSAIHDRPSPHHRDRGGQQVRILVLHADASPTVAATLSWCMNPVSKVSYHYLIGRTGSLYQLVPEARAAYHAGKSEWKGEKVKGGVNDFSIGVSFSNKQDGKEAFTEEQLDAGALLVEDITHRHGIPLGNIVTHAQIATPPGRKTDPTPGGPFDLMDFLRRVQSNMACRS